MNLLSQSNQSSLYGGIDSILISIDDVRLVNSKLVELNYKDDIIYNYKKLSAEDSATISKLRYDASILVEENNNYKIDNAKLKKQRNICFGVGITSLILFLTTLIAK